jgi:hypothetical protein
MKTCLVHFNKELKAKMNKEMITKRKVVEKV